MDVLVRYAILGAAGLAFAIGPAWSHLGILLLYPLAANAKQHTFGFVVTFYGVALLPAALAAWDYSHSISWLLIAWCTPWLINSALLSAALIQQEMHRRTVFTLAALLGLSVPPLSTVSVITPAPVAGLLFPGFGITGIVLLYGLIALSLIIRRQNRLPQLLTLGALTLCSASAYATAASKMSGTDASTIQALQTYRGMPTAIEANAFDRAWRFDTLQRADASTATTVVFPESTFGDWQGADARLLNTSGKEIIGGARVRLEESTYVNVLISNRRGVVYQQRQPLPVSFGHSRQAVKATDALTKKSAIDALLCIELANPWITLTTFINADEVVVWAANFGWSKRNRLLRRLQANLDLWARLFDVRAISAVNHPELSDA